MHKLKEEFREVFEKNREGNEGLFALSDWIKKAMAYFPKSCQTIRRWIDEITAYFDNRTTQGTVEGINNKLKVIKRRGYGFRNFKNFSLRCLWLYRTCHVKLSTTHDWKAYILRLWVFIRLIFINFRALLGREGTWGIFYSVSSEEPCLLNWHFASWFYMVSSEEPKI